MTGWRIGYGAASKEIIQAISKLQSQSTTNPSSISQAAAVEALLGKHRVLLRKEAAEFKKRRDYVVKELNSIKGLSCVNPKGAFYVFPSCKNTMGKKTVAGNNN